MKKFLLAGILLVGLSSIGLASDGYSSNMADLEASLQALQAEERQILEARRQEAVSAQERVRGQRALLVQIQKREEQIEKYQAYKFFQPEYKLLKKKYSDLKKDVDSGIKAQERVITELTGATQTKK
jgi:PAB1-binding protein PBP1